MRAKGNPDLLHDETGERAPTEPSATTPPEGDVGSDRRREERRLADATRRLTNAFAETDAPAVVLAEAAATLESLNAKLESFPAAAHDDGTNMAERHRRTAFTGPASTVSPPMRFEILDDDRVDAFVTFDRPFEGPPGRVHGGYVAAAFDVALARAQSLTGHMAMTVELDVRYLLGTPLLEELRLACQLDRIDAQRVHTSGVLYAGDRRCAEAVGVFHMGRKRGLPPSTTDRRAKA